MKEWFFVIDVERCENCNNCFLSCKDEHVGNDWSPYAAPMPGQGPGWTTVQGVERGEYPFVDVAYLPFHCMHCDEAPCVKSSADGAVYKRSDGIVLIDPVKAKGRKDLVGACPYNAIQWNEELQLPQKCTFCAHLLDQGWTKTRCAQSCPTGALSVRHVEGSEFQEMIRMENLEVHHLERNTRPRVHYRNLYRFTRCFIGGSVAVKEKDRTECAQGAVVTLFDGANRKIAEYRTDSFGDFKFDNLEENSGRYTLQVAYRGFETKSIGVDLKKSFYAGVIHI